ncbi:MAG: sensor histidine kinase [Pseudolabrys sp.]
MSGINATQSAAAVRPTTAGAAAGYRLTLAIIGLYTLATLALLTVAARPGPVMPGISAFFAAGVFVTETATAFLLFVRFRDDRTWSMLVLACAYLFSGAMAAPYLLAFPGALLRDVSVIGESQTIAWIFLAWIFGFAALTFAAAVLEARMLASVATQDVSRLIGSGVVCVLAAVTAVVVIAVGASDWLPQQVGPTGWTAWDNIISAANMALLVAGLLVILVVIRGRNEIFLWVALALAAMLFGNVLSTFGGGRFTVGWSFSRVSWVFSGCALFLYFMGQFVRQQRLLGKTRDALEMRVGERTADLTNMISQRDLLLREVHHRVKNNFQVINSLISFESSHASSDETRDTLRNLHGRVYALGLVHQRLMQSTDLATFDIRAFLDDLCANLASLSSADTRGITLSAHAEALPADLDFAGPLGLLVTELVTAAFERFTDGGKGEIKVSIRRGDVARLVLTVSDNAPVDENADHGPSRIMRALVGQLRGELALAHDGGTVVTVVMPDPDA